MSKFKIVKKVSLATLLGEGHEQSYISFKPMTFKDAKQLEKLQSTEDFSPQLPPAPADTADQTTKAKYQAEVKRLTAEAQARENEASLKAVDKAVEFMASKFVEGNIAGVPVAVEDFSNDELGVEVINYCMGQLAGAKPEGFTNS